MLIAIDPGPTKSAACLMQEVAGRFIPKQFLTLENSEFIHWLRSAATLANYLACEKATNYGEAGETVMDTQLMVGRCMEVGLDAGCVVTLVYPRQKASALCHRVRGVTKPMMNASLKSTFGDGSKTGKGTKKEPGLLYGIKDHEWSALAVGQTWAILFPLGDLDVQTIENVVQPPEGEPRERWRKERDNKRRPKDKVEAKAEPVEPGPEAFDSRAALVGDFSKGTELWKLLSYCRICAKVPGECTCRDGFQPASTPTAPVPF